MRHVIHCIIQKGDKFLLKQSKFRDELDIIKFEKDPDVYQEGQLLRNLWSSIKLYEKSFNFILIGKRLSYDVQNMEPILLFEYYIYDINDDINLEENTDYKLVSPTYMYFLKSKSKLSDTAFHSIIPIYQAFDTFLSSWESIH